MTQSRHFEQNVWLAWAPKTYQRLSQKRINVAVKETATLPVLFYVINVPAVKGFGLSANT